VQKDEKNGSDSCLCATEKAQIIDSKKNRSDEGYICLRLGLSCPDIPRNGSGEDIFSGDLPAVVKSPEWTVA
jgi:hypothetical protein